MFEKVLYPTDFSDPSKKALDYVKQLKESGAEEVIVLHVIEDREIPVFLGLDEGDPVPGTQLEKTLRIIEENAKEETRAIAAELKESGFDVKIRIEKGTAFREILKVEEEEEVSVIVVGSHGKGPVTGILLGSVSDKVIRKSKKPVLIIKR
ncbi:MAG: universal stress protein [Desulfobacteraceae bacterium]|nr:universal stress protein [Desulfobacteraceae bacterium]